MKDIKGGIGEGGSHGDGGRGGGGTELELMAGVTLDYCPQPQSKYITLCHHKDPPGAFS